MTDIAPDSRPSLARQLLEIGPLRLALGLSALVLAVFAPAPGIETRLEGWGLIATGVLPALGPIVFFALLLDMLMSRVLMSDTDAAGRRRYRTAMLFDGAMALVLLLAWLPFLLDLAARA
ncbi:MAG: hypothetical protein GX093_09080 [Xanthomonadaceae bacterium]|nr:hypothetical protein [Xanthomonadaceae bacterium]